MQKCNLTGNISSIRLMTGEKVDSVTGERKGTKVFLSVADHYYSYKDNEQKTRFISVQGFLPKNLKLKVGQLINVDFVINTYQDKEGNWRDANDIINWDVSLFSANRTNEEDAEVPTPQRKAVA